jgi:hypothetical protein
MLIVRSTAPAEANGAEIVALAVARAAVLEDLAARMVAVIRM